MERRKFLILSGVGAAGIVIPGAVYFAAGSVKQYAALMIERQLSYLKLEPGSVAKYIDESFKNGNNSNMVRLKWKALYYLHIGWERSDEVLELIKYYLLSTDFFINKMDESKMVSYLGLYNPYKSPVPNPFSFIIYPPEDIKEP